MTDTSTATPILKLRLEPFTGCVDTFSVEGVDVHNASANEPPSANPEDLHYEDFI